MPVYRFGGFTLDTEVYALSRDGAPVSASPRQLDLLAFLLAHPSRLVTRDELFDVLWPDVTVTDNTLTQLVSELRTTLGDPTASPQFVQTVARRGYRFVARVDPEPPIPASPEPHVNVRERRGRETSNLEALRAASEGRLKLEALHSDQVDAAIDDFNLAITLDAGFGAAYVGRANARFWKYELRRSGFRPDRDLLASAINDARRGISLAEEFAEAHATLAYLLTAAAQLDDAQSSARRAIQLEPRHWSHHFRLGNATWGEERLSALRRCLQLYPAFPFAHFQMAMVHVARHALEPARRLLDEGIALLDDATETHSRFPASGLHWLRGLIALAHGDADSALTDFGSELDAGNQTLYAREFSIAALNAKGFTLLGLDRLDEAEQAFGLSLSTDAEQVRPHLGLAELAHDRRKTEAVTTASDNAQEAVDRLRLGSRHVETTLMTAGLLVVKRQPDAAADALDRLLSDTAAGPVGWSIPIDPLFASLAYDPVFTRVLRQLADRAK